ncbi:extensin family protein [Methyloligella sp. 2.7D]|uniref:extensin-like domain-containing protein n=1 Tax=unclassified Methyloligella TaxID=2625955 RepID=UPI00157D5AB1|nr:extensin family protein [Methyloligella sp. GL2]QKP77604.1 extensin family protein [Methyloligella sp. GL2]
MRKVQPIAVAAFLFALSASAFADEVPPLPERKPTGNAWSDLVDKFKAAVPKPDPGPVLPEDRPAVAWTDEEVSTAKAECDQLLSEFKIDYEPLPPIRQGACGTPAPILVKSIGDNPKIDIVPPAKLQCKMAAHLNSWFSEVVQPKAKNLFGAPVVKVRNAADYDCRNRYGAKVGKLSEHARADALDISSFTLESGSTVALASNWPKFVTPTTPPLPVRNPKRLADEAAAAKQAAERKVQLARAESSMMRLVGDSILEVVKMPARAEAAEAPGGAALTPAVADGSLKPTLAVAGPPSETSKGQFMRAIHKGACAYFGTVLGPEANAAHKSHFHLDGIDRASNYCQ